jgi:16S rRNA U516 pseudouridylate synthase RsuA-like enzyme
VPCLQLIEQGRVKLNGKLVTTQGVKVDPLKDMVEVDGKPLVAGTQHVYFLVNKPKARTSCSAGPPRCR